jgi:hypothetical protein
VLRRLKADVFPMIGKRPIAEIEAPELVSMVKAIEEREVRTTSQSVLWRRLGRYSVTPLHTATPAVILPLILSRATF